MGRAEIAPYKSIVIYGFYKTSATPNPTKAAPPVEIVNAAAVESPAVEAYVNAAAPADATPNPNSPVELPPS